MLATALLLLITLLRATASTCTVPESLGWSLTHLNSRLWTERERSSRELSRLMCYPLALYLESKDWKSAEERTRVKRLVAEYWTLPDPCSLPKGYLPYNSFWYKALMYIGKDNVWYTYKSSFQQDTRWYALRFMYGLRLPKQLAWVLMP